MAGILASSPSVTMLSGDATEDNAFAGWVTGERITLSTTPTGTDYSWGQASPNSSALTRSALSSTTATAPTFTPDVAGTYVVTVAVDGATTYVLRLTVRAAAIAEPVEASRYSPRGDTQIPAPALGWSVYFSSTLGTWVAKDPNGIIIPLRPGDVGAALTDADVTIQIAAGNIRPLPAGVLTGNHSVTLGTSGASAGHVIEIPRYDVGAFTLAVINGGAGAGTLHTFPVSATGWAKFKFGGTNWTLDELRSLS